MKETIYGWHAGKHRYTVLLYKPHGGLELIDRLDNDSSAAEQGTGHAHGPGKTVIHGKDAQGRIFCRQWNRFHKITGIGVKVPVTEHGPFGFARCSRCVDDGRWIGFRKGHGHKFLLWRMMELIKGNLHQRRSRKLLQRFCKRQRLLYDKKLHRCILDDIGNLPRHELKIDGNNDAASLDDSKIGDNEFQTVLADKTDTVSLFYT